MTPEAALAALRAGADPERAARMAAYHKTEREVLGLPMEAIDAAARDWRAALEAEGEAGGDPLAARVALAAGLWDTGVFEARIAAAKLLTQARIRGDAAAWRLIASWVPRFDGWAIADAASAAGARRLSAAPERLDEVASWVGSEHMWTRRAALVMTLPWTKARHPSAEEAAQRERILGWAAELVPDRAWFIQKAVGWWLRSLSERDPDRVRRFLDAHGAAMKPFAAREAARKLPG